MPCFSVCVFRRRRGRSMCTHRGPAHAQRLAYSQLATVSARGRRRRRRGKRLAHVSSDPPRLLLPRAARAGGVWRGRRQCRRAIALIASGSSRTRARAAAAAAVACPVSRCAGLCSAPGGPPASAEAFLSPPGPRAPYIFWLFGRSVGRPTSTPSGSSLSPP